MNRREALFSLSGIVASLAVAPQLRAKELHNVPLETQLSADHLPQPAWQDGYQVLTNPLDRQNLQAIFDRLIPADKLGPSATEAGCIEFLDNQLAGDYGSGAALYLQAPLHPENEEKIMGSPQFLSAPKERYLTGLKALENWAQKKYQSSFHALNAEQVDDFLTKMEDGKIDLGALVNSQAFFELIAHCGR